MSPDVTSMDNEEKQELLPCPFCGSVAVILDKRYEGTMASGMETPEPYAACNSGCVKMRPIPCDNWPSGRKSGALTYKQARAQAIAAWNRRASPPSATHGVLSQIAYVAGEALGTDTDHRSADTALALVKTLAQRVAWLKRNEPRPEPTQPARFPSESECEAAYHSGQYKSGATAGGVRAVRSLCLAGAQPPKTFDKLGADRLADEVAVLIARKVIDSRSPAGDALLDYRDPQPMHSPRAERIADLERELESLRGLAGREAGAGSAELDEALAMVDGVRAGKIKVRLRNAGPVKPPSDDDLSDSVPAPAGERERAMEECAALLDKDAAHHRKYLQTAQSPAVSHGLLLLENLARDIRSLKSQPAAPPSEALITP